MRKMDFDGHAPSFLPEGENWRLVWNDEFDGDILDETKWLYRTCFWGKRFPAFTDHEGVELDGASHLRLHMVRNPDGTVSSPHLQTGSLLFDIPRGGSGKKTFWPFGAPPRPTFLHRYGFYEIRCRFPRENRCWHSAFWLQAPGIGSHPDARQAGVECDIMESYRLAKENLIVAGNLWGGYGDDGHVSNHFRWNHVETPDRWHYYAVNWEPDCYTFYVDGRRQGRIVSPERAAERRMTPGKDYPREDDVMVGPVSQVQQFLLVSTEVAGWRSGACSPDANKIELPNYFEVDHVRVFDSEKLAGTQPVPVDQAGDLDAKGIFMF